MFPKLPIVRRAWMEEFAKVGMDREREDEVSWNTCLRLLDGELIKAGVIRLGDQPNEFQTF